MLDLLGLTEDEAQQAIYAQVSEMRAADYRSVDQCRGTAEEKRRYKEYIDRKWAGGRLNRDVR